MTLSLPHPGDEVQHPVHGLGRVWEVNLNRMDAVVLYDLGDDVPLPYRFRVKRLPIAWFDEPDMLDNLHVVRLA